MRKTALGVLAAAGMSVMLGAQQREPQPSCAMCPGTFIGREEINAYVNRAIANNITDQQVRAVDIGKGRVGVGVVHREKQSTAEPVAEHDLVSELYHVISGHATLMLGPDLLEKERRPASQKTVRVQNGPGNSAKAIRNGVSYNLGPGDVVVIPAGTGHQFTKIDEDITYLMLRFDPDEIVPTKSEAESRADLRTSGLETADEARAAGAKNQHLERQYEPSCRMCPGYYIPKAEVDAYIARAVKNQFTDQGIRTVDIGRANVSVGVVYRVPFANPENNVSEHDLVSEAYHVIDGRATLNLGPDLVEKVRRPSDLTTVRLLNGPGNNATAIRNGVAAEIRRGDVVTIPAGTGHQFTRVDEPLTYLIVRVDPDKVLPLKSEAQSLEDLKTDGRATAGGGAGATNPAAPRPR